MCEGKQTEGVAWTETLHIRSTQSKMLHYSYTAQTCSLLLNTHNELAAAKQILHYITSLFQLANTIQQISSAAEIMLFLSQFVAQTLVFFLKAWTKYKLSLHSANVS